ncbi:MAG: outer membrane scaffolding protein for murein synthesis (MipA/OmpV family) [Alphaproteobacteria bacterium]|jgi:outer membrane scaffolding protein for murein synthesis (MipA/OmpV family)
MGSLLASSLDAETTQVLGDAADSPVIEAKDQFSASFALSIGSISSVSK